MIKTKKKEIKESIKTDICMKKFLILILYILFQVVLIYFVWDVTDLAIQELDTAIQKLVNEK